MKHDPHTEQIIRSAHDIIRTMNSLIQCFHAGEENWKNSAALLKYSAAHIQRHLDHHIELVIGLKEESE